MTRFKLDLFNFLAFDASVSGGEKYRNLQGPYQFVNGVLAISECLRI